MFKFSFSDFLRPIHRTCLPLRSSFPILSLLALLVSCESPQGNFEAFQDLTFNKRIRISTGSKIIVPQGNYGAKITLHPTTKVLEMKLDTIDTIRFRFPQANLINLYQVGTQTLHLRAAQIEQPFDIQGNLEITKTLSENRFERESCVLYTYYDYYGRLRTVYGSRDVEFHWETYYRDYTFNLMNEGTPESQVKLGIYQGKSTDSVKVIDYQGRCY